MGKLIGFGSPWNQEPVEYSRVPGTTRLYYREIWFLSWRFDKWVLDDDPPKLSGDYMLEEITEDEARAVVEAERHKWADPRSSENTVTYEEFNRLLEASIARPPQRPQARE